MSNTAIARAYRWLCDNGPANCPTVAKAIGAPLATVQASMARLTSEGRLSKTGRSTRDYKWRVVDRRWQMGERRGKSPGSRKALREYGGTGGRRTQINPNSLANLLGVNVQGGRYIPKPGRGIALEQAWGRMPIIDISGIDAAE